MKSVDRPLIQKRRTIGRRIAILAAISCIALIAAGYSVFSSREVRGSWVVVERGEMKIQVQATGELESAESSIISVPSNVDCTWDFEISEMADEGADVQEGDLLLAFDTSDLREKRDLLRSGLDAALKELEKVRLEVEAKITQLELDQAEARIAAIKARQKTEASALESSSIEIRKAHLDHEMAQMQLKAVGDKFKVERRNGEASVREVEGRVRRTREELASYEVCIERMSIKAPQAGVVVYKARRWNNEKYKRGDDAWPGQVIMELPNLQRMQVAAEIPEPDAGRVQVGQAVEIRLDADPSRIFHGRIESLGRFFRPRSLEKPSMVFDATVHIDAPDSDLMRPGMAAQVAITVEAISDALLVPENAVNFGSAGAYLRAGGAVGRLRRVPVEVGRRSGGVIEVLSGVEEGVRVLVRGVGEE